MKSFYSRQQPQVALLSIVALALAGHTTFNAASGPGPGNNVEDGKYVIDIPHGALVTKITAKSVVGFNTGGTTPTAKLTVNDADDTFVNAQSVTGVGDITVAGTALGNVGKFYPVGGRIEVAVTEGAASGQINATAGQVLLVVEYLQLGVEHTIQG